MAIEEPVQDMPEEESPRAAVESAPPPSYNERAERMAPAYAQQPSSRASAPASSPAMTTRSAHPSAPMTPFDMRTTQLSSSPAAQPVSASSDQRRQRRSESLFTRITGFGLVRPSNQHHEEDEVVERLPDEMEAGQQQLGVSPSDRPSLSAEQSDDLLEIPAFLRRQSNH
jgi:hypothetical protein